MLCSKALGGGVVVEIKERAELHYSTHEAQVWDSASGAFVNIFTAIRLFRNNLLKCMHDMGAPQFS